MTLRGTVGGREAVLPPVAFFANVRPEAPRAARTTSQAPNVAAPSLQARVAKTNTEADQAGGKAVTLTEP